MLLTIFFIFAFTSQILAYSVPEISIESYQTNSLIPIYANELDSVLTQFNFEHYYLNFCGAEQAQKKEESFGGTLLGVSKFTTPYSVNMANNETCKALCVKNNHDDVERFKWVIDMNYSVNLVIDGLPAISRLVNYTRNVGFPVGWKTEQTNKYYIYNHLELIIYISQYYSQYIPEDSRIVGFQVIPHSVNTVTTNKGTDVAECTLNPNQKVNFKTADPQVLKVGGKIAYSYDVKFVESPVAFGSRWDTYKEGSQDEKIHWFSIMNSVLINFILIVVLCYILKRAKRIDYLPLQDYSRHEETSEEIQDQGGWKQLSRDVFRPPNHPLLLSTFIGAGIQVRTTMCLILLTDFLGLFIFSPRGTLLTIIIILYNLMGMFAGYHSARIYKMFNGVHWIKCALVTGLLFPGINFLVFYAINIMLVFEESSSAIHVDTVLSWIALWFGISIPLVLIGSLVGYKKQVIVNPCKYNPTPKFIKPQPWYLNTNVLCLLGGLLPFGSIFIELVFVMMSIWEHSFYYFTVFLFLAVCNMIITSIVTSILITYLHLCRGNHRVWWSSFFNTGSTAIYILLYSIFYFYTELQITRISSTLIYFGYMTLISLACFLLCGATGFFGSYWFTRKIYSTGNIDN